MLGATGSIGESTLDLIGRDPAAYEVVALTGCKNGTRLAELAEAQDRGLEHEPPAERDEYRVDDEDAQRQGDAGAHQQREGW